jgi:hypothetical protein
MRRNNRELWAALIACLIATLVYLVVTTALGDIPGASSLFGHSLGIFGFLLMLMTETLYSYRKRARRARWGHMSNWLDFTSSPASSGLSWCCCTPPGNSTAWRAWCC